jgi:ParB-like nuclease domain
MHAATLVQHFEIWAIERLTVYDRNARIHSDAQVSQIARSIEKYGFIVAILVDGDEQVIAGHGRLRAARRLGMARFPVNCILEGGTRSWYNLWKLVNHQEGVAGANS